MKILSYVTCILPVIWMGITTSYAICTNNPILEKDTSFPIALQGRMVYHSYINYGDGSSNLFMKDFYTQEIKQINQPNWDIEDPMNAHFSPDGRWLIFMGKQYNRWNIFIWKVGSAALPINLTKHTDLTGGRSEDPKFSSDGTYIVYKSDGDIALARLNYNDPLSPRISISKKLTNNGFNPEESMSYLSSHNKYVFYSRDVGSYSDIYQLNINISRMTAIGLPVSVRGAARQRLADFYPVVLKNNVYYVGWKDFLKKNDQIYASNVRSELALNDCQANNSDPMPIDNSHLLFSSTRQSNVYRLFLGNISTGKVWALTKFGVDQADKNELGATYTNTRPVTSNKWKRPR